MLSAHRLRSAALFFKFIFSVSLNVNLHKKIVIKQIIEKKCPTVYFNLLREGANNSIKTRFLEYPGLFYDTFVHHICVTVSLGKLISVLK